MATVFVITAINARFSIISIPPVVVVVVVHSSKRTALTVCSL